MRTPCSRGPAVHEAAEGKQYIRQQRASSISGSRELAVHQAADGQQYIQKLRSGSTSGIKGPAVHHASEGGQYITLNPSSVWPKTIYGARIIKKKKWKFITQAHQTIYLTRHFQEFISNQEWRWYFNLQGGMVYYRIKIETMVPRLSRRRRAE